MTQLTGPRLTSFAPQVLVDELDRALAYYRDVLGFGFGEPWGGFYVIGQRDGFVLPLKEAPKNLAEREHRLRNEHLDAYARVTEIEAFYADCAAKGSTVLKPLVPTSWGTKDFYLKDPDGYILGFGGALRPQPSASTGFG